MDFARSIVGWTEWGDKAKVPHLNLFQEPFLRRMVISWMVGFEIYGGLQIPYYFFATVTTALGICRPEQWPPIFGEFSKNAYRVRTWWGKCWHQQLRRSITTPAQAIVKALDLPKGDVSKYTELWLAFFFSSLVHSVSGYFVGRSTGGMFTIWMAQAAIITIEDYVIKYAQQYGIKDSSTCARSCSIQPFTLCSCADIFGIQSIRVFSASSGPSLGCAGGLRCPQALQ